MVSNSLALMVGRMRFCKPDSQGRVARTEAVQRSHNLAEGNSYLRYSLRVQELHIPLAILLLSIFRSYFFYLVLLFLILPMYCPPFLLLFLFLLLLFSSFFLLLLPHPHPIVLFFSVPLILCLLCLPPLSCTLHHHCLLATSVSIMKAILILFLSLICPANQLLPPK